MRNEQLEIFVSIVDCGSISAAAQRLMTTQSTVSSALNAMEAELGKSLIMRTRGQRTRLIPTEDGSYFYEYAQEVLRLYEKLRIRMMHAPDNVRPVRLVAGQTLSVTLLTGMLKGLRRTTPALATTLLVRHVSTEAEIRAAFSDTPCDFAFVTRAVDDEELVSEAVLDDPIVLICNRSLSIGDSVTLGDLSSLPLVLREASCATMINLAKTLEKNGLSYAALKPALSVYGASAVRESVKYGALCGFVPLTAYRPGEDMPHIRVVRVKGFESRRTVYLLRRRAVELEPEMRMFRRFVLSNEWRSEFAL